MEEIQKQVRNPWVTGITGFIIGAMIGLFVLGWWLFPVEWTDAEPSDLVASEQQNWIEMAASEFELSKNPAQAQERYDALGETKQQALTATGNELGILPAEVYAGYVMAVESENAAEIITGAPLVPAESETTEEGSSSLAALFTIFLGIMVAVLAAVGIYLVLKRLANRQTRMDEFEEVVEEHGIPDDDKPVMPISSEVMPISQFLSTYRIGSEHYDDSFSIDSPQGEFMGECGAGISEHIGVGDPAKVTAIEVWLFDKNDIQTVTKVLMSDNAYHDENIRKRLEAKGEPVLANPNEEFLLETQTLRMSINIVDMAYGEGPLPPGSFFERMVLELTVWSKPA